MIYHKHLDFHFVTPSYNRYFDESTQTINLWKCKHKESLWYPIFIYNEEKPMILFWVFLETAYYFVWWHLILKNKTTYYLYSSEVYLNVYLAYLFCRFLQ